jgi:hypothetical protein
VGGWVLTTIIRSLILFQSDFFLMAPFLRGSLQGGEEDASLQYNANCPATTLESVAAASTTTQVARGGHRHLDRIQVSWVGGNGWILPIQSSGSWVGKRGKKKI